MEGFAKQRLLSHTVETSTKLEMEKACTPNLKADFIRHFLLMEERISRITKLLLKMLGVSFGGNKNSTNTINVKNESEREKLPNFFETPPGNSV
jgi:hypothetical protein